MNAGPTLHVDLRGFRWKLHAVELRFEGELEGTRLALARLQQQSTALADAQSSRAAHRAAQEALALATVRRDVFAGAHATRYLAGLAAELATGDADQAELQERLASVRQACAQVQRRLESAQALRIAAQREHAQAQLRREGREADAVWLALAQLRRARAVAGAKEAA